VKRELLVAVVLLILSGCYQPMSDNGAYKPLDPTPMFADGRSSRDPIPGTVARGQLNADESYFTGRKNGELTTEFPKPVTKEMLERGRQRFNINCSMCHGYDGYGDGMVVRRGFTKPPSYHTDALRGAPVGHFFDVITNGKGAMYSQAARVSVDDRWAIAAYIRALQLSQYAPQQDAGRMPIAEATP
jgi:mono/diheme cytochrome c family protein